MYRKSMVLLALVWIATVRPAQAQTCLEQVGFLGTPSYPAGVAAAGEYVYVAAGQSGLRVVDVSTPTAPWQAGIVNTPGGASDVSVAGGYAYVADEQSGLRVIDISTPTAPVEVGHLDTPNWAVEVAVAGGYAYVADTSRLRVIDVSTPAAPWEAGSLYIGTTYGVAVAGEYVYVAAFLGGLRVIDVSTPAAPLEVGFVDTPGFAQGVALAGGGYAYVADYLEGLRVIDISTPAEPFEVGFVDTPGIAYGVEVVGEYAYVADEQSGLRVIDISSPAAPVEVGFVNTPAPWFAMDVDVAGGYAHVADLASGLRVVDVSCFPGGVEESCFDGLDDDDDELVDCADPDCDGATGGACDTGLPGMCSSGTRTCSEGLELCIPNSGSDEGPFGDSTCSDDIDNDCDGLVDGGDPDCAVAGPVLSVDEVALYHQEYPSGTWVDVPAEGTIDGNVMRIEASVLNAGAAGNGLVEFRDVVSGLLLPPNGQSTTFFPAGTVTNISIEWDTSGFAWDDGGSPQSDRLVRVSVPGDSLTSPTKVAPKPLILVHGLWSNSCTWSEYSSDISQACDGGPQNGFVQDSHPEWSAFAVDVNTGIRGRTCPDPIITNAQELFLFVEDSRDLLDAWKVDLVAHSKGGLISRFYIHHWMGNTPWGDPVVSHLLTVGTPHSGTPCARRWPFCGASELSPIDVSLFNTAVVDRKNVPFSALAGKWWQFFGHCDPFNPIIFNDSVVDAESAVHLISDVDAERAIRHDHMTASSEVFDEFVLPRLALGPSSAGLRSGDGVLEGPLAPLTTSEPQLIHVEAGLVPALGILQVQFWVPEGSDLGVLFATEEAIETTLTAPSLNRVAETGSAPLRSFVAESPEIGMWELRFSNPSTADIGVHLSVWLEGNPNSLSVDVNPPDGQGQVQVTATLTSDGQPVSGAQMTVTMSGLSAPTVQFQLFDDGLHGDGAADDGIYGGGNETEPLEMDYYQLLTTAEGIGFSLSTTGTLDLRPEFLFLDGFEVGTTAAWSRAVP